MPIMTHYSSGCTNAPPALDTCDRFGIDLCALGLGQVSTRVQCVECLARRNRGNGWPWLGCLAPLSCETSLGQVCHFFDAAPMPFALDVSRDTLEACCARHGCAPTYTVADKDCALDAMCLMMGWARTPNTGASCVRTTGGGNQGSERSSSNTSRCKP